MRRLSRRQARLLQLRKPTTTPIYEELREVTTPEMFDSQGDVLARGARQQQTEIIALNAALLEVATEDGMHWASVRFSGSVRESPRDAPEAFDEVWNLRKPVSGDTGWLLAGIQQPA
jgi:predicted lipid-binding transport protein (Tim44 family)